MLEGVEWSGWKEGSGSSEGGLSGIGVSGRTGFDGFLSGKLPTVVITPAVDWPSLAV